MRSTDFSRRLPLTGGPVSGAVQDGGTVSVFLSREDRRREEVFVHNTAD